MTPGYTRFKSRDGFNLVEFLSDGDGRRLTGQRLYLQDAGHAKIELHRPVDRKVKTVSTKSLRTIYYATFSCDLGVTLQTTGEGGVVGVGLGLKMFLVTSDGEAVEPRCRDWKAQVKSMRAQRK